VAWKIADAKQRFSEVVRRAQHQPQVIQNRDRPVAVVMSPEAAARAL
jgi:prevent-host-death family protein